MTTHVLIVNDKTFNVHLEYLFAGTGSKDKKVDFNNNSKTCLHYTSENGLIGMMADGSRIRKNDFIIFYVQSSSSSEGKFFGIFQAIDNGIFLEDYSPRQYLLSALGKNLTFRFMIKPYKVYSNGITEWEALDEIKNICAPQQMLWSLIYRKLRGNRGNTMITLYESDRLLDLIRKKNSNSLTISNNQRYLYQKGQITVSDLPTTPYKGQKTSINLLPRMYCKYQSNLSHESHLQQYITQNIGLGTNISLDEAIGINGKSIEWLGNEVACGVGMQRIDIMLSLEESLDERIIMPIELKSVPVTNSTVFQLDRYINWLEQYYIPNRPSTIQPVLICKKSQKSSNVTQSFRNFNINGLTRYLPLRYIEYDFDCNENINFNQISY